MVHSQRIQYGAMVVYLSRLVTKGSSGRPYGRCVDGAGPAKRRQPR